MADWDARYRRDQDPYYNNYNRYKREEYEPSAPPYYEQQQQQQRRERDQYPPKASSSSSAFGAFDDYSSPPPGQDYPPEREPPLGRPHENETLGAYAFSRLIRPLWRGSHSILRIDLRRSLALDGPIFGGTSKRSTPSGTVASSGGRDYYDEEETQGSRGWVNGISGGGARLKLMQVWDAPPGLLGHERQRHWNLNVGFGLNLELDKGLLEPRIRVRARHVGLHLLPQPEVELRAKWPLVGTRMAVNVKYRLPLTMGGLEELWTSAGARLMVNFYNPIGSGFHLTPGGVEFDEHMMQLGRHTKLRFAASLQFPRKLPLEEGEQPVKIRVHRLGVKTVIEPGVTV